MACLQHSLIGCLIMMCMHKYVICVCVCACVEVGIAVSGGAANRESDCGAAGTDSD